MADPILALLAGVLLLQFLCWLLMEIDIWRSNLTGVTYLRFPAILVPILGLSFSAWYLYNRREFRRRERDPRSR